MGRCWLWGAGPPQTFSAQVGYLPGLSVWSLHVLPVFTRGFLHQKPQQKKHAKEHNTLRRSLTKTDGSSHLVPGRLKKKASPCSWGPGGRTVRDGTMAEAKFTNDLRPACVSSVASMYSRVLQCVVCRGVKSTEMLYSSKSTITLMKFYLSTSKITHLKIYSSKSKKIGRASCRERV